MSAGRLPLAALAILLALPAGAEARTLRVPPRPGALAGALAAAAAGDTVLLGAGTHRGPARLVRTVVLRGEPGAVVDGGGAGSVLSVEAPGCVVEDLAVRGSGPRVITIDSGIRVLSAPGVRIRRVRGEDLLYGVYAERAPGLEIAGCTLEGRVTPRAEIGEGNGIHLWTTRGARITGNRVTRFMDAIYLSFADSVEAGRNTLTRNGRYGFHTMYCQGTRLLGNEYSYNLAGCAIMFSNHLLVRGNAFVHNRGPRTYGLLLRDCSDGEFAANRIVDNTIGVFLDNSNRNRIHDNLVQDNGWGVLLFSSCAGNEFAGNSFVNDDFPVALDMKYTDNRFDDGRRGNFWDDAHAYDLDGDGVGDAPWTPVSTFAFLSKQVPDLSVLSTSPAVAALGVAERVFPALRPSQALDRFPLTAPAQAGVDGSAPAPPPARAWGAFAGFGGLFGLGAAGLARARRR